MYYILYSSKNILKVFRYWPFYSVYVSVKELVELSLGQYPNISAFLAEQPPLSLAESSPEAPDIY